MKLAIIAALSLAVAAPVFAAEEVLKGVLVCAKCELKKADAHECQDVLLVETAEGRTLEYYVTKNEVAEKSGEACTVRIPATVTGSVSRGEDGKSWITPTKIEKH